LNQKKIFIISYIYTQYIYYLELVVVDVELIEVGTVSELGDDPVLQNRPHELARRGVVHRPYKLQHQLREKERWIFCLP
jgi:hypothetical protein